jgi:hypothetical protein
MSFVVNKVPVIRTFLSVLWYSPSTIIWWRLHFNISIICHQLSKWQQCWTEHFFSHVIFTYEVSSKATNSHVWYGVQEIGRYSPILQSHNPPNCTSYEITNIYIQMAYQFTFTVPANQMHPLNTQKKYIYHNMAIQETSQRVWWFGRGGGAQCTLISKQ